MKFVQFNTISRKEKNRWEWEQELEHVPEMESYKEYSEFLWEQSKKTGQTSCKMFLECVFMLPPAAEKSGFILDYLLHLLLETSWMLKLYFM